MSNTMHDTEYLKYVPHEIYNIFLKMVGSLRNVLLWLVCVCIHVEQIMQNKEKKFAT